MALKQKKPLRRESGVEPNSLSSILSRRNILRFQGGKSHPNSRTYFKPEKQNKKPNKPRNYLNVAFPISGYADYLAFELHHALLLAFTVGLPFLDSFRCDLGQLFLIPLPAPPALASSFTGH